MHRLRWRLDWQYIQSGANQTAFLQTPLNGIEVDNLSTSCVDKYGILRQERKQLIINQVPRLASSGAVDRQDARPPKQILYFLRSLNTHRLVRAIGEIGVVEINVPAKGFRAEGYSCAYPA